jgi:hypothetical protein
LAEAIREGYEDLFHISERPTAGDRAAIEGKFKSVHNATDRVAAEQAKTFYALLALADLDGASKSKPQERRAAGRDADQTAVDEEGDAHEEDDEQKEKPRHRKKARREAQPDGEDLEGAGMRPTFAGLRYNIEVHLPATKDVEVYNAIFKSLKEHLLDD